MVVVTSLIFIVSIQMLSDFLRTAHCFSVVKNSTIGPYGTTIPNVRTYDTDAFLPRAKQEKRDNLKM